MTRLAVWSLAGALTLCGATALADGGQPHTHAHGSLRAKLHQLSSGHERDPRHRGDVARGTVYLDWNDNGVRDHFERGLRGVSVSNGIDVVQTDAFGRYEITLPPESVLFITKPAGYDVPVNEDKLPQFYYLHYPDGTPKVAEFEFPVVEPTGPLPEHIDFRLLPGRDQTTFKALAFADTQSSSDEELDMLRIDVIDPLIDDAHGAEFGLTVGDVVDDALNLYGRHNRMMAQIGVPMWNLPGNHDMNFRSPNDRYATETFKSVFGPTDYSFDYGRVHFIALDNVQYAGDGNEPFASGRYRGYLSPEQLQWIQNDLQFVPKDKLIVIATHIPLITYALDSDGQRYEQGGNINTVNLGDLLAILEPFRHIYGMAGHDTSNSWKVEVNHEHGWHGYPFIAHTLAEVRGSDWSNGPRDERGVRAATMADGNPNGYYVVRFDGTDVKPKFMPASRNPPDAMRIVLDPLLTAEEPNQSVALERGKLVPGTRVVVNLFDGGERDRVELSIDGGEYRAMTNILRTDPFMERQFARYQGTEDKFPSPAPSSHIWEYPLADLGPGLHVLRVRSVDEFGQRARSALSFEVVAD